jgi:hopanoid biosynthesis associated RND transporter like protein HpnN
MADAVEHEDEVARELLDAFAARLARAVEATLDARFHRLSWQQLLAGEHGDARRRIVVATPVLDYRQLFPADRAIGVVRGAARELGLVAERGVRVRITGGLAMSDEELRSVSTGAGRAALLALAGVGLVLLLGLGSVRLVLVTLLTLLAGLVWTAAFAAAAVGDLNMISVAFAVLYIGLGVDYAVHYGLRYRELLATGADHEGAIEGAGADVGGAIALCALTTGVGLFAFLPTSFAGVSELGLIAGVGMFVSLATTLTLMPALLTALRPRRRNAIGRLGVHLPLGRGLDRVGRDRPRLVCGVAAAVAVASAVTITGASFDDNPLNLRDPRGEAVSTYRELVAEADKWSLDVLVDSASAARELAARLRRLPEVRAVVWLDDFVPEDQDTALAQAEELALLLGPDLQRPPGPASPPRAAGEPLRRLEGLLAAAPVQGPGLTDLREALRRWLDAQRDAPSDTARAERLQRLHAAVVGSLPDALARLGAMLDPTTVTAGDLPPVLLRDWRAPDGRLRLRVDAAVDLNDSDALAQFVGRVRAAAPGAVGTPIVHLESARAVVTAFAEAFALAFACITVILYLALRRAGEVVVVLTPLLLASLATVALVTTAGIAFNFANVIALPLLLGVGVDSGIHMLTRARIGAHDDPLSGSSTARGVITSALTTVVSFGNLALSPHPGTASMGVLLSIGMVATLIATLLVLPALLTLLARRGARGSLA